MSEICAELVPPGPAARSLPRLGTAALPLLLVFGLVTLCPASAVAQGDDDRAALALLRRSMIAASEVSYQGTQVDATWTPTGMTTRMIEVRQVAGVLRGITVRTSGGTTTTLSLPLRDGSGSGSGSGSAVGSGSGSGSAVASGPGSGPVVGSGAGAGAVLDPLTLLAGAYALTVGGRDSLLGRAASEVVALRNGRVAARLWLDDASGLLLRQEVWDSGGRLTRMVSFVELSGVTVTGTARSSVGTSARTSALVGPAMAAASGAMIAAGTDPGAGASSSAVDDAQVTARRLGSPCPMALPGGYRLVDARAVDVTGKAGAGGSAIHLTYSDGLSAISVFVQVGRLPLGGPSGMSAQDWDGQRVYVGTGWPSRVVWEGGGHVFTGVSDAPVDELADAVAALPGRRSGSGVLDRIAVIMRTAAVLLPGR